MRTTLLLTAALAAGCNLFADLPATDELPRDSGLEHLADVTNPPDADTDISAVRDVGLDARSESDASVGDTGGAADVTTDAPVADVNTPDATVDADPDVTADTGPTDPCSWPDTMFCSGFEDPTFGDWDQSFDFMCGLTHDTSLAHSGTGSMRVEAFVPGGECGVISSFQPPLDNDDEIWLRAWIYLPSGLDIDYFEWGDIVNYGTMERANPGIGTNSVDGHFHLNSYDGSPSSGYPVPRDQWTCFEWNVRTSAAAGRSLLAINGTTIVDADALPIIVKDPLDNLAVGLVYTNNAQSGAIFIDDVFLGRSRPGCD